MRLAIAGLVFLLFFTVSAALTVGDRAYDLERSQKSSNYGAVKEALDRFQQDLEEISPTSRFRAATAATYIHELANSAYAMDGDDYTPSGEQEVSRFLAEANETAQQIFDIRVLLNKRLLMFQAQGQVNDEIIRAFRRAHLYLGYAADFVVTRRATLSEKNQRLQHQTAGFFGSPLPFTLLNREILSANQLSIQSGDIILVRGASFISATIARIGDEVSNMSHLAMVAETPEGRLKVVEALMERKVVAYDLEEYLKLERLPRVAIYRSVSKAGQNLSRKAGQELWKIFLESQAKPTGYQFDLQMNLHENGKIFCAKLARMAWQRASGGRISPPAYLTSFADALKTDFAKGIQMTASRSFSPADIEVDPMFTLIAEHRDPDLLGESRRFDVVLSVLFEKFKRGFTYIPDAGAGIQAVAAVFARDLGFDLKQVPADAKVETMATLIRHRNLVERLMRELERLEMQSARRLGRPLSYRELESLFERACKSDCIDSRAKSTVSI